MRRRLADHLATTFAVATVVIVLAPLIAIFAYLVYRGFGSLNWAFLTQTPKPPGRCFCLGSTRKTRKCVSG